MTETTRTADSILREHRQRRVFRIATAYALVSWVLLQLGEITFEPLKLPSWSLTALIWFLVLGFPIVVLLAWLFEKTPTGLRRVRGGSVGGTLTLVAVVVVLDVLAGYSLYSYYAVDEDTPVADAAGSIPAEISTAPPNSIAVLPFVDLSPEGDQQYFSDGISEEILNVLAKVEGLHVAARTSAFTFRSEERDIREIGRLLNVATVLEGSIRKAGDSIRVTAQLIDAEKGFHLWSQNYDRKLEDIFAIQDEIAGEIAKALLGSYEGFADLGQSQPGIASFEAYDLYLQGRNLWQRRTPAALTEAVAVFQKTLEIDPAYAPAYSGLADAYLLLSNYGNLNPAEAIGLATPLIQTALELDGQMSEGFASLGLMYWRLGRFTAAEAHLERATRLDPENTTAAMWRGALIGAQGRLAEELLILTAALERDPLNPLININLAGNHLRRGDYDAGIHRLLQMLEVYPTSTLVLNSLAAWSAGYGRMEDAMEYARRALSIAPADPSTQARMTDLLLTLGERESVRQLLDDALETGRENALVAESYARYLMVTGRIDELQTFANARLESLGDTVVANEETLMPVFWLARASLLAGDAAGALIQFERMLQDLSKLSPSYAADTLTWAAAAHRDNGQPELASERVDEAGRLIRQLRLQGVEQPSLSYLEACVAALSDDRSAALEKLNEAHHQGWVALWDAENDQRLGSLREESEFQSWVEGIRVRSESTRGQLEAQFVAAL